MIEETLAVRLRRLRRERGLSQRETACPERKATAVYVCRIERGQRYPSVAVMRALAEKLGVTARYLETGADPVMDGLAAAGVPYETLSADERALLDEIVDRELREAGGKAAGRIRRYRADATDRDLDEIGGLA